MHAGARAVLILVWAPAGVLLAQTVKPTIEQRLAERAQRIKVLKRKRELANEAATAAAVSTPVWLMTTPILMAERAAPA